MRWPNVSRKFAKRDPAGPPPMTPTREPSSSEMRIAPYPASSRPAKPHEQDHQVRVRRPDSAQDEGNEEDLGRWIWADEAWLWAQDTEDTAARANRRFRPRHRGGQHAHTAFPRVSGDLRVQGRWGQDEDGSSVGVTLHFSHRQPPMAQVHVPLLRAPARVRPVRPALGR